MTARTRWYVETRGHRSELWSHHQKQPDLLPLGEKRGPPGLIRTEKKKPAEAPVADSMARNGPPSLRGAEVKLRAGDEAADANQTVKSAAKASAKQVQQGGKAGPPSLSTSEKLPPLGKDKPKGQAGGGPPLSSVKTPSSVSGPPPLGVNGPPPLGGGAAQPKAGGPPPLGKPSGPPTLGKPTTVGPPPLGGSETNDKPPNDKPPSDKPPSR
jgi:hypothetical protein